MNKVVCNLCGTSYPENAAQCPICGYARTSETENSDKSTYTYVKGGRFSKSNVKKRNQAAGTKSEHTAATAKRSSSQKGGAGITIVIIILLLAIVAVLGYIALRFFLPNDFLFEGLDNLKLPSSMQEEVPEGTEDEPITEPEETEPDLSCTAVLIEQIQVQFDAIGAEVKLSVEVEPLNTTDTLSFSSSDVSVATVSEDGVVKSVGEGSAVITVICGTASTECNVTCTLPTEPEPQISLNRKEITFDVEGQSWLLYDGEIPVTDIVWTTDDENIASINNGKVTAVGNGDTTIYGIYNEQSVSCIIHCKLDEEGSSESGSISEAGGESNRTYKLYNPTGYSDDVTLNVGEKFTLKLVDENYEEITDAEWKVDDSRVCSYKNGTVKALRSGYTEVTATYEGVTYTCIVRVN